MGYYNSVYLNRMNRFGENLQQRILNRKEYDFNNFIKKSPHRVTVCKTDCSFIGVLQTKEYDDIETIDYFLTHKSTPIKTGDILPILDIKDPENLRSYWIVTAKDNFVSAGYNRYTVVKMDREIRWITGEGYLFRALTHISGAGANARDKRITSKFKVNNDAIVFLPNQNLTLTMQDHEEIKRGVRVNINNQVWRITGKDNFTTEGVAYVTLEQDYTSNEDLDRELTKEKTPESGKEEKGKDIISGKPLEAIPNVRQLEKWEIDTTLREDKCSVVLQPSGLYELLPEGSNDNLKKCIFLKINTPTDIGFSIKYFDQEVDDAEIICETDERYIKFSKGGPDTSPSIIATEYLDGYGIEFKVSLVNNPDVFETFIIFPANPEAIISDFSVEGPTRLRLRQPVIISSTYDFEIQTQGLEGILEIKPVEENTKKQYTITGLKIQKNIPVTFKAGFQTYTVNYTVESPWIGGIM